ncbi:MAG: hypothetical protein M4579_005746 [Chaenotheca gracillima]|nr:MAG: hypothetical protein M4579_005746 [Chaenotheca gracillima]
MYKILRILELREVDGSIFMLQAWLWVLGVGLGKFLEAFFETWMWWTGWGHIGVPIRAQLTAMIFAKAMRRKDIKGSQETTDEDEPRENGNGKPKIGSGKKTKDNSGPQDASQQKSRQSQINLVAVDTARAMEFCVQCIFFPISFLLLGISVVFLAKLIGWRSLLAGLSVSVLITPFNIHFAKRYSSAQDDLMKVRDVKMGVVTEALQGMRQIKFSALEKQWSKKIGDVRGKELKVLWTVFICDTMLIFTWIATPVLLAAVALGVYAVLHGGISPSVAFTAISVFGQLELSLSVIPELTTMLLDALVSFNRIGEYLESPEKESKITPGDSICFSNALVAWPTDNTNKVDTRTEQFTLRDINMEFPNGELSIISGKTGSGKSMLIASVMGEAELQSGIIKAPKAPSLQDRYDHKATSANWIIPSSIAYVAQIPWIENASLKDNILFGLPLDEQRYRQVMSTCALEKDLTMLSDGDLTEIGANGINLSGGQRWRVSFARALYSRAGILLLDDIFSAVDTHVGRHLLEKALVGELGRGRTRLLVTHHVGLCLPYAQYSVLLNNGIVEHAGTIDELKRTGSLSDILDQEISGPSGETESLEDVDPEADDHAVSGKILSEPKKFVEDEKKEKGMVKLDIYKTYFKSTGGFWFCLAVMLCFLVYELMILGRSWWVRLWTQSYQTQSTFSKQMAVQMHVMHDPKIYLASSDPNKDLPYWLGIYFGISVALCFMGTLRYLWVLTGSLRASRRLFEGLTEAVLHAPLRWLDTVPTGRILNRFTADFNVIDTRMGYDGAFFMGKVLELVGIFIAGLFVTPLMILFGVIILAVCIYYAMRYLAGAREVKRLESNTKSPILEVFSAALTGLGTIRAFDKADDYVSRMFVKIDDHTTTEWHLWLINRWFALRMGALGALFAALVAAVVIMAKGMDPSLAGFALSFALQYTEAVIWVMRRYANMELNMNATERIVEYWRLPTEDQSGEDVPAIWPHSGHVEVKNLVVGYADDLAPVLKGLNFTIESNQRIGVVGRTGAGKSSLTLALYRFLEAREGCIKIDGIDISKIRLEDLRGRLAIIPQDPVLFSGTVRSNLDPFGQYDDADLRDALERVHLVHGATSRDELATGASTPTMTESESNLNVFESLSSTISESGLNLSQGQRQLLCLARAIVARPKLMILDEATSAVDMSTDALIQQSIREEFTDSTLLVIAHRLSTIVDFDKVLVMAEGKVEEFDTPASLMEKKGEFWKMVEESGERGSLEAVIMGSGGGSGAGSGKGSGTASGGTSSAATLTG